MKNECDIVKDLLFSYCDGVLTQTSKELVEEHLKNCENCRNILEEIKQDDKSPKQKKEVDFLKSIKKKLNKKNIIISITLIFLACIVIFNILTFRYYNEMASKMEIYLQDDISDEDIENIKNKITEISSNIEVEYISKEKGLERMKDKLGDEKNILDGFNVNRFYESIEIKANSEEIETILSAIKDMSGIRKIITYENNNPYELFIGYLLTK